LVRPPLHPTTTTSLSLPHLPITDLKPIGCPSPLLRDVGPPSSRSTDGYGREEQGGDPGSGRPRWCVTRTRQTKVVSRSRCSYLSKATTDHLGTPFPPRHAHATSTTLPLVKLPKPPPRRPGGPRMTWQVQSPRSRPPMATRTAGRCSKPIANQTRWEATTE